MQIGMMGLGRMGANMVRRLMRDGHECVVYDINPASVAALVADGAIGAASVEEFVGKLSQAAQRLADAAGGDHRPDRRRSPALMEAGDIIIDGGNSYYHDAVDRAASSPEGHRLCRCRHQRRRLGPRPRLLPDDRRSRRRGAPPRSGVRDACTGGPAAAETAGTAPLGYLHCGPSGAGHFVKMVHNGIEYGVMAAYAEGMNILKAANSASGKRDADAETSPLQNPEYYQFDIDLAAVAEVWRHGSVIGSWLLDLTAGALKTDPALAQFGGRVSDSGEGRWTLKAAIDTGVPAPVLSSALFDRFSSQGESEFADKLLSAMRYAFGGHVEKPKA